MITITAIFQVTFERIKLTETDRQTDRQTDRPNKKTDSDRQRDTDRTEKQMDKQTDTPPNRTTDSETDWQTECTDTQTSKQKDRPRDRLTDRQTDRHVRIQTQRIYTHVQTHRPANIKKNRDTDRPWYRLTDRHVQTQTSKRKTDGQTIGANLRIYLQHTPLIDNSESHSLSHHKREVGLYRNECALSRRHHRVCHRETTSSSHSNRHPLQQRQFDMVECWLQSNTHIEGGQKSFRFSQQCSVW